jgi:hypothetical protein
MPYRISYLDTSMFADERLTAGMSQTEEFSRDFILGQLRASGRSILQAG